MSPGAGSRTGRDPSETARSDAWAPDRTLGTPAPHSGPVCPFPPAPVPLPWAGISARGVRVTLTETTNEYPGASRYFTVGYGVKRNGRPRVVRYTPSEDRARVLVTRFLADVTDPAGLR